MKSIRWIAPAVLISAGAFGQSAPRLEFEVASIRPTAPQDAAVQQMKLGAHIDGAQVTINSLSLKDYIRIAYKLKHYQVIAPDWTAADRFDIAAKLPEGGNRDQVPDMLQTLLEDRFKLKTHNENREFPVYALVAAKGGLKLKESAVDPTAADVPAPAARPATNVNVNAGARGVNIDFGGGSYFSFADNKLEGRKLTMAQFADAIGRFTDRPVVDMTDTKGLYDVTLNLTQEDYMAMLIRSAVSAGVQLPPQALMLLEHNSGDSLTSSLQAAGLKLDARKAPLPVLVVDKMEKVATDN